MLPHYKYEWTPLCARQQQTHINKVLACLLTWNITMENAGKWKKQKHTALDATR
ncbi:MAG: hypothetical protein IPL33_18125 [Sphingobacteriales bacterium]|nr:hypothetical protein [Sphingobacteriales bacterium]